ncbi:type II secretion system ATPase GspE [Candidatus Dependentiae bacterium]|nr:type II secretion system ATPase GspE [Candidatus Dependentiae bacterium]
MVKKTFAQILLEHTSYTQQDIEAFKSASGEAHQSLEDYLLEHGLIKDEDFARAYSEQFSVTFIETITEKMADPELLSKVPLKFLREHVIVPIRYQDQIAIVTSNPYDFQPLDDLILLLGGEKRYLVSTRSHIIDAINRYYPLEGTKQMIEELEEEKEMENVDFGTIQEEDILGMASEAPIIKLVNHILYQAVKRGSSDIHIEPFEKELRVRYRIDGVMYTAFLPPKRAQAALLSRIKIMANMNIAEKRIPQDGRIQIKIADKPIDIRVSVLPVSFGERVVMRLLDKSKTFGALQKLGFSERDYSIIEQSIVQPNGIMLITGPTGSGKTSTLYSILSTLNSPEVNIVTVEDPVEYQMQGIGQVQVKESIGLTFAAALRSILRQDPDIVMIGELRDQETAQIAIQAALTGHLVLSTLHTNSASATITRLIDMGIEPFLIASTIVVVVAQRLVRRLCDNCKRAYKPTSVALKRLPIDPAEIENLVFYEPVGCDECLHTGYRGRLAIFEIMVMTHAVARLTLERADTALIQEQAVKDGMTLLVEDGLRKIKKGQTTIEEVLAVAASHEGIQG